MESSRVVDGFRRPICPRFATMFLRIDRRNESQKQLKYYRFTLRISTPISVAYGPTGRRERTSDPFECATRGNKCLNSYRSHVILPNYKVFKRTIVLPRQHYFIR